MSPNPDDEPVVYLGSQSGEQPPAQAPPPADDAPVEGYLGGATGQQNEELPALPPAGVSAVYSASDFIAPPPEVEEEPPAYDSYAAEAVAEPAPSQADVEQYAQPPEPNPGTATVVEQTSQSSDFDEPGLPKTISQQDAENIIKRITTKKILPPEVAQNEGPRVNPPAELTPRGSPKLGRLAFVVFLLVAGYGAAVYFNDQVAQYIPQELWPFIFYQPPPPPPPVKVVEDPPEVKKEKALRKTLLESEWRAFGYASETDMTAANKDLKAADGAKKPDAPDGSDPKTPGGH